MRVTPWACASFQTVVFAKARVVTWCNSKAQHSLDPLHEQSKVAFVKFTVPNKSDGNTKIENTSVRWRVVRNDGDE